MSGNHGLHVYETDAHVAAHVAAFATSALSEGAHAILVPARPHRAPVIAALRERGVAVTAEAEAGRLLLLDADAIAEKCVAESDVGGAWAAFEGILAATRVRGARRVAVWGEATDLLLQAGRAALHADLEARWHAAAAADAQLEVRCSARADLLGEGRDLADLEVAFAFHTHVTEVADEGHVGTVVEEAAVEVLGARMAWMAWALAEARPAAVTGLPVSLSRLLWLSDQMPSTWARIRELARARR